jgi:uncharacterized protein with HEPN domain
MPDRGPASDLTEVLNAIDRVTAYVAGMDEPAFAASMIAYDAVLMNLLVIGEAVRRIDPAVLAAEPSIKWPLAIGLRNRIAHGYEDIEPDKIWLTVVNDLPPLRAAVVRLLTAHGAPP